VFPKLSKLLNREDALSAPCSPPAPARGAGNAADRLDPSLRCHLLFAVTDSSHRQALMLSRWLGGGCTGGADRCKAKQGRREEGADVWGSYFHSSTAFGPCPEQEKIFGNYGAALFVTIAQESDCRCGRFILSQTLGRESGDRVCGWMPGARRIAPGWGGFRWIKAGSLLACYGCCCKDNVPSCPAFIQVNPLNLSEPPLPDDARQRILFDLGVGPFCWPVAL
jgi:hypothetical protein